MHSLPPKPICRARTASSRTRPRSVNVVVGGYPVLSNDDWLLVGQPIGHMLACSRLIGRGYRVLEIEDDRISPRRHRLGEAIRPVTGNEEIGAQDRSRHHIRLD